MTPLLAEVIAEFADLEPRERLEMLLDYAEQLPPLSPEREQERLAGDHRIHECQTPVFVWVDLPDGKVNVQAWVAPEAPTVKGFVGVLVAAFKGVTPTEVLETPADLMTKMGLSEALGMVRSRGLGAILFIFVNRSRERT